MHLNSGDNERGERVRERGRVCVEAAEYGRGSLLLGFIFKGARVAMLQAYGSERVLLRDCWGVGVLKALVSSRSECPRGVGLQAGRVYPSRRRQDLMLQNQLIMSFGRRALYWWYKDVYVQCSVAMKAL